MVKHSIACERSNYAPSYSSRQHSLEKTKATHIHPLQMPH